MLLKTIMRSSSNAVYKPMPIARSSLIGGQLRHQTSI